MSNESFDPYFKWLGISPADQPPTHYRLLGLDAFTSDEDVISNAADRQMMMIRTFQTGPYGDLSQRLLSELATARSCLLDSHTRDDYDRQLKARTGTPQRANISRETFVASTPPSPAGAVAADSAPNRLAVPMTPPVVASRPAQSVGFGVEPTATSPEIVRQRKKLPIAKRMGARQNSNVVFWVVGIGLGGLLLFTVILLFRLAGGGAATEPNNLPDGSNESAASVDESAGPSSTDDQRGSLSSSIDNWNVVGSRDWQFDNGEISTELEMQPGSWLMSRGKYGDCSITFEYVLQSDGAGGVYVRVPSDATWPWNQGLEIHLRDDRAASGLDHESTGSIWHRTPPNRIASRPIGQWNQCRVECRGRDVTVEINGDQVTNYRMIDRMPRVGHVGLDGVSGGIVYRNFVVQELK
jgi:hypothetical protein